MTKPGPGSTLLLHQHQTSNQPLKCLRCGTIVTFEPNDGHVAAVALQLLCGLRHKLTLSMVQLGIRMTYFYISASFNGKLLRFWTFNGT